MRAASEETPSQTPCAGEWRLNTTSNRALTLEQLGRFSEALVDWELCLTLAPPERQPVVQMQRALNLAQSGRDEEAVVEVEALAAAEADGKASVGTKPQTSIGSGEWQLWAARVLARTAEASADRQEEYAVRSIELLRTAGNSGYFATPDKLRELREDPHLASLRSRSDYQTWLAKLDNELSTTAE